MNRQQILDGVRNLILAANSCLFPDDVGEAASLTYDLGMDSFHLESLISRIKSDICDVEFTPWYVKAARGGQDTVGSLVDYIEARQPKAKPVVAAPVLVTPVELHAALAVGMRPEVVIGETEQP